MNLSTSTPEQPGVRPGASGTTSSNRSDSPPASGRAAAKLDRDAMHDRVLGVIERSAIVPAVDREPDRARIDIDRVVEALRPLKVRVPAGDQCVPSDLPRRKIV